MRTAATTTTIPTIAQTRLPLKPPRTGGGMTVMFVLLDVTIDAVDTSEPVMEVVTVVAFATTVDTVVTVTVWAVTTGKNRRIEARGFVPTSYPSVNLGPIEV